MKYIKIDNKNTISLKNKSFIIAEIGSNHNQSLALAYKMIDKAKYCGADAVKFQSFKASKHFSKFSPSFKFLKNKPMYKLIESLELNREWHKKLFNYCKKKKILFFSSPCDNDAVDDLEKLGVPLYKIASFDITDLELIKYVAKTKKPIILSTGLSSISDIERAVKTCKKAGNKKIILLECTSLYPAPENLMNLNAISVLRNKFKVITGLSDHSLGDHMILASIGNGAKVIEKHFTLNQKMKGPDHKFAMEPEDFKNMIDKIRKVESGLGTGKKGILSKDEKVMALKGRRSIHSSKELRKNATIEKNDLIFKRPGLGIEPYKWKKLIGKKVNKKIKKDFWIKWEDIKKY
jgi:sialic acid synthase SpsE